MPNVSVNAHEILAQVKKILYVFSMIQKSVGRTASKCLNIKLIINRQKCSVNKHVNESDMKNVHSLD